MPFDGIISYIQDHITLTSKHIQNRKKGTNLKFKWPNMSVSVSQSQTQVMLEVNKSINLRSNDKVFIFTQLIFIFQHNIFLCQFT